MFRFPAKSLLSETPQRDPHTGKINYVLSREDVVAYAQSINPAISPYFCAATGELASSIWDVIRTSVSDLCKHRFVHSWCRTRTWQK